ncbi:MAG: sigma-70 family RNA polymerase sigma factor [Woeseiaceae bacterium]|nr:sigma-70 family RNA polymerase sigma factor [Woeseiaceae bacterium]
MNRRHRELVDVLPNIRRFALSLTGHVADADDLLQSTVERLLERGLPDDVDVTAWSLRVCRNLWIDEMRSRKVRRDAQREPAVIGEQVLPGEEQVLGEMTLEEVQQALFSLSEDQRAVLELVAIEGHSYKEAAAILEVPIGTVMSRLARARTALIEKSGIAAGG